MTVIMRGAEQQPNKQTNKLPQGHKHWKRFRQKNKKPYLQIDAQADLQVGTRTHTRTQKGKHKMKHEALCSVVIEINK